jgi:hypothetical protein
MIDDLKALLRGKADATARRHLITIIYLVLLGGLAVMGWIFWALIYLLLFRRSG